MFDTIVTRDKFVFKIYLNPLFEIWTDLVVIFYKITQNSEVFLDILLQYIPHTYIECQCFRFILSGFGDNLKKDWKVHI